MTDDLNEDVRYLLMTYKLFNSLGLTPRQADIVYRNIAHRDDRIKELEGLLRQVINCRESIGLPVILKTNIRQAIEPPK